MTPVSTLIDNHNSTISTTDGGAGTEGGSPQTTQSLAELLPDAAPDDITAAIAALMLNEGCTYTEAHLVVSTLATRTATSRKMHYGLDRFAATDYPSELYNVLWRVFRHRNVLAQLDPLGTAARVLKLVLKGDEEGFFHMQAMSGGELICSFQLIPAGCS